jgi:octaheme c-type cytochrome (tetrathionate reductase family)
MSWRVKSTTVNALVILTLVVIGLTLAGKVFDSRIDAVGPTEPPGDPSDTIHPWEARQDEARLRSEEVVPLVKEVLKETPSQRRIRLGDEVPQLKDLKFSYFLLNNPLIKKEENLYGTVRFMHKKHAAFLNDCFICHHHRPPDPKALETTRCSACHQASFNPELPGRIGLQGAHHRQCMDCHKRWNRGPVGCTDCHDKNVPNHSELVKLSGKPEPTDVIKECIRCHDAQAEEMLTSTHWLWRGPSTFTEGYEKRIDLGKATTTINNFAIHVASNWPRCTACHAGYGWKDTSFDFTDKTRIDCLVCHDTTGTYKKAPAGAGLPDPEVDLVRVAKNVGKPSRGTCGSCHFSGGDRDPVKHGKLNPFLDFHSSSCDVHMGGLGFQCHDCHQTRNHKIAGRSLALPVAEGSRSCTDCHTSSPHMGKELLNHHLNRHTEHLACMTCHNPIYAKCNPVKTFWDWSTAGDKSRKVHRDEHGMVDYEWKTGSSTWEGMVKPSYAWYNGKVRRYLLGDKINTSGVTGITEPVGQIKDPKSKIYPFKVMRGRQAADAVYNYLLVPHLFGSGGYWETLHWPKAFAEGMEAAGLPYSGEYKWVDTIMYLGLTHEVLPKKFALSCVQCHASLKTKRSCGRCHQDKRQVDFEELAYSGIDFKLAHSRGRSANDWTKSTFYIGFEKLGYKGDPIVFGGRFKQLPLGWREASKKK